MWAENNKVLKWKTWQKDKIQILKFCKGFEKMLCVFNAEVQKLRLGKVYGYYLK